jgi:hypothetical protein
LAAQQPLITRFAVGDSTGRRRIRDYIYSQTQLAAFYDENDIPFGSVFRRVLERDVQGEETAALVVVRSARYSSRPCCRRELSLFRRPIPETPDPITAVRWRLSPVVVVEAIEGGGRTAGIPELGNAPELTAFYPGRGLSGLELDILFEFFPNIEFRSFEEVLS